MVTIGSNPIPSDFVGQMLALQRQIRGGILNAAIQVERALDLIIADHFCQPRSERWWQLYNLVLASGNLTFQRKEEIVLELLRNCYPGELKKYPAIKYELEQVRKNRNTVAHSETGMSQGFATGNPPDHITLVGYRGGKQTFRKLTLDEAARMEKEAQQVFHELAEVAQTVARTWSTSA